MPKVYKIVQKRHVFLFLTVFFAFSSLLIPFIGSPGASAAPTSAEWIDNFNLSYQGNIYQSDDENNVWVFYRLDDPDGHPDVIKDINWAPDDAGDRVDDPGDNDTTAKYEVHVADPTGDRIQSTEEIDLTDSVNATKTLFWNGEYIVTKSKRPLVFQKDKNSTDNWYKRVDGEENRCPDTLEIAVGASTGRLTLRVKEDLVSDNTPIFGDLGENHTEKIFNENSGYSYISLADYDNTQNKCYVSETFDVTVSDASKSTVPGTGDSNGDTADIGLGLGGGGDNPTCESSGFVLSWIFCPIVNAALDTMDWMFRVVIEPFLLFSPLTTNSDDLAYKAWRGFRTLGNIILVFALLIIVFGQSIGRGLVDAYTAKKAMPRILIAAILINLSYFIVALSVDVFNVLGMGVGQLINAPLNGSGSFNFTPNNILSGTGLLATVLGGTWLLSFVTTGGFFIVMLTSFIIPMLLTTIAIFGTLIIRRGLIILLAIISPVALALYALPGTEKYAKKWLDLLIKSLVVYPIIMIIFAVADLLSQLMFSTAGNGGSYSINQFVALVVLFIPFFLIPFAFKLAGGAVASISGAVTGFNKKRYDKYMGSEFDQHSRKNQVHGHIRSARITRNEHRGEAFRALATYRRTRRPATPLPGGPPPGTPTTTPWPGGPGGPPPPPPPPGGPPPPPPGGPGGPAFPPPVGPGGPPPPPPPPGGPPPPPPGGPGGPPPPPPGGPGGPAFPPPVGPAIKPNFAPVVPGPTPAVDPIVATVLPGSTPAVDPIVATVLPGSTRRSVSAWHTPGAPSSPINKGLDNENFNVDSNPKQQASNDNQDN